MCGIAGIVDARPGAFVAQDLVHRMCEKIVYRGPDDEGIYAKNGTGLGMRRLSIIDLPGGHQPVFNEDHSAWIVFNGEIYNFLELRPELEKRGHVFRTHSDTEVILHLYEEMGDACVQQLRGMFAFAIYDERRQRLLLARDRLGKKPLHYALVNGRLIFASEIKSILEVAPELVDIDPSSLWQYMYLGYVPDPATAFRGIHKLPAGYLLTFENGKVTIRQYWDLPEYATHQPRSEEECLSEMEHRLEEAVRIRLIADVPLGAMLSGGTDSSAVVALMSRLSSKPVKTFSIGFRHADFNEAEYARVVAQKFGTDHHELILDPDVIETVDALTSSLEEPFGDSSMLPTYYISRMAREHVKVALSGDGGDELFAGYERYRIHLHERSYNWIPKGAGRFYRDQIHPLVPYKTPGRNMAYSVSLPWQERYMEGVTIAAFIREMHLLSDEFREEALGGGDSLSTLRKYIQNAPAKDALSRVLYLDTKTYLVGDILTKVDRMSMMCSLEARVPILDHKFVEWVTGLRPEWKMRGGSLKYIFRRLAERLGVPSEVLHRPKQGFALPLRNWMRHELKPMILDILLDRNTMQRGYFQEAGVRRLLDEHFSERRDHSARIWRFLIFELWHRNFLEKASSSQSAGSIYSASSFSEAVG